MNWFKMHHTLLGDPKFGLAARDSQESRAVVIAVALAMLTHASQHDERGSLEGFSVDECSLLLDIEASRVTHVTNALLHRKFVTDDKITNWERYQSADKTASERAKRYRDNKKKQEVEKSERVTNVTSRTVTRDVTQEKIREDKNILEDESSKNSPKPKKFSEDFERLLWMPWPQSRRCEKPNAWKAWQEALRKIPAEQLGEAIRQYLASEEAKPDRHGEIFVPYPAKWLKRERWQEITGPDVGGATAPIDLTLADLGGDTPENRGMLQMLGAARAAHGDAVFRSWLMPLRLHHKNCTILTLSAPTRFMAEWVTSKFSADLEREAARVWPEITTVIVEHQKSQTA